MLTGSTCARSAASDRRRRIFEHVCVTPLVACFGGVGELAAHQLAVDRHAAQHVGGHPQAQPEPGRGIVRGERATGAGVPAEQFAERIGAPIR